MELLSLAFGFVVFLVIAVIAAPIVICVLLYKNSEKSYREWAENVAHKREYLSDEEIAKQKMQQILKEDEKEKEKIIKAVKNSVKETEWMEFDLSECEETIKTISFVLSSKREAFDFSKKFNHYEVPPKYSAVNVTITLKYPDMDAFKVLWEYKSAKIETSIDCENYDFPYYKKREKLNNIYLAEIENLEKKYFSTADKYIVFPYKYEVVRRNPQEIIDLHEYWQPDDTKITRFFEYPDYSESGYIKIDVRERTYGLISGESYYTDEAIYLAKYRTTDYFHQTNNIMALNSFESDDKGRLAEFILPKLLFDNHSDEYIRKLYNVYMPIGEQEIDVLVLTKKGLFVLECKNRRLPIGFESVSSEYWKSGKNDSFYNPVLQNKGHITCLSESLKGRFPVDEIPIYNYVVFLSDGKNSTFIRECDIEVEEILANDQTLYIGSEGFATAGVEGIFENNEDVLSEETIDKIYDFLYPGTQYSQEKKEEIIKRHKGVK